MDPISVSGEWNSHYSTLSDGGRPSNSLTYQIVFLLKSTSGTLSYLYNVKLRLVDFQNTLQD